MSSNQTSIIPDKNNSTISKTTRKIGGMANHFNSDSFKKLITHRRGSVKKIFLTQNKRKFTNNHAVKNNKSISSELSVLRNFFFDNNLPNSDLMVSSRTPVCLDNLVEKNIGVLSQCRSHGYAEELNRLIKKITLSFSVEKNECQFVIKDGIFNGGKFDIVKNNKQLLLRVSDIDTVAEKVLRQHQNILKYRLARREINLHNITFC